ncbi:NAD(P)/FAD-dependent oxidoreductase [Roseovarius sp. C7]|uniref:NAD(P)/FAD-dependent oxidoreductase n=1 Tax=Roseovarius sp. C7 TaxID=3398643 RepID=UPI0039F4E29B
MPNLLSDPAPLSLWDSSAEEADVTRAFAEDGAQVDLAIVGAGFTGLSAALHAAELGLSTHVLEAEKPGFGGSGRNVGLVNAGIWLPPAEVREKMGTAQGAKFLKAFGEAPARVFDLIEKHQIRCEVTRTGTLHAAHGPSGLRDLEARHAEWQRMGEPVDLLDQSKMARLTGTEAFHGGLLDHRAGTINPMGYCRGLARAALAQGAEISTGVMVSSLARKDGLWRVETVQGTLLARHVILATNAYTDTLWPGLQRSFTPIHFFQLATPPLGAEAAHILPERQGLWDTGRVMMSLRRDAQDRLVIGSMGTVFGDARRGLSRRWASKKLTQLFPDLGPFEFEEAWHGQIAMTPDHFPRICALDDGLYTAIGYNGRGITTGTLFGRAMVDLITGKSPDILPLPLSDPEPVTNAPILSRLYQGAFTVNQIFKSL